MGRGGGEGAVHGGKDFLIEVAVEFEFVADGGALPDVDGPHGDDGGRTGLDVHGGGVGVCREGEGEGEREGGEEEGEEGGGLHFVVIVVVVVLIG